MKKVETINSEVIAKNNENVLSSLLKSIQLGLGSVLIEEEYDNLAIVKAKVLDILINLDIKLKEIEYGKFAIEVLKDFEDHKSKKGAKKCGRSVKNVKK